MTEHKTMEYTVNSPLSINKSHYSTVPNGKELSDMSQKPSHLVSQGDPLRRNAITPVNDVIYGVQKYEVDKGSNAFQNTIITLDGNETRRRSSIGGPYPER